MIGRLLCRIGLHKYPTVWSNIAPISGGGEHYVNERCVRCFYWHTARNWQ